MTDEDTYASIMAAILANPTPEVDADEVATGAPVKISRSGVFPAPSDSKDGLPEWWLSSEDRAKITKTRIRDGEVRDLNGVFVRVRFSA